MIVNERKKLANFLKNDMKIIYTNKLAKNNLFFLLCRVFKAIFLSTYYKLL